MAKFLTVLMIIAIAAVMCQLTLLGYEYVTIGYGLHPLLVGFCLMICLAYGYIVVRVGQAWDSASDFDSEDPKDITNDVYRAL